MNAFLWILLGLLVWGAIAVPVGVLVGKVVRRRDAR